MNQGASFLNISESFIILYSGPNYKLMEDAINRTYKKMFVLGCYPDLQERGLKVLFINANHDFDIERSMPALKDEYYSLEIKDREVFGVLNAYTILGALRGLETFSQLIQVSKKVPSWATHNCQPSPFYINTPVSIQDQPAFVHRGLLLDTARHYMPKKIIKRVLDGMEASKLNVFHWHIIDSQSFPLQSEVLPALSNEGAYSEFEVYSIQDVKDIVKYAKNRGIRVIPGIFLLLSLEFDIPGHAYSWKGSNLVVCPDAKPWEKYCASPPCGQLDISKNETFEMLEKFIKEMASVFPSQNIHLGHDEVNTACYLEDPNFNAVLNSGTDLATLLQRFQDNVQRIATTVKKTIVFWEEVILDFPTKVPLNTIIQTWKGINGSRLALERGYRVIVSDYSSWYLDCKILKIIE
jgi:hexosaminidase